MRSGTRRLGACALLATVWLDRDPRLLTIIGPGGTGKTRFSIERARFLAEDADGGTVFVPLAPVRDAATPSPQMKGILGTDSGDRFGGFSGRFKACRGRDRLAAELLNLRAKALYERESAARCREFKILHGKEEVDRSHRASVAVDPFTTADVVNPDSRALRVTGDDNLGDWR
jgi:hypothetical protein